MSQIIKLTGVLIAIFMTTTANAGLVIIGHANYEGGQLDSASIKRIFLGERNSFPEGQRATPINHAVGSPDRKEFFDSVLAMDESAHRRHWSRMLSTGKGTSPVELNSYEAVLDWVAKNPGSIAYIDPKMVNDSVKVLLKIEDFSTLAQIDDNSGQ